MPHYFASDNWAGAHPKIAEALSLEAGEVAAAYGSSDLDHRVADRFNEIFEKDVAVFFLPTGTAANAVGLSSVNVPGGVIFCHREAHIIVDECNAPSFSSGGAKMQAVDGPLGKMRARDIDTAIKHVLGGGLNAGQPMAVSITQATESGTVYDLRDIAAISKICRKHGMPLHMDGARFTNAMMHLNCSPAEMTWKAGIDILSFGATKNGCWCAEALVFFDPDMARQLPYLRKRGGHLLSKMRFVTCQLDAYLNDGLWIDNAMNANRMGLEIANVVESAKNLRLAWHPQVNEVFAITTAAHAERLRDRGLHFAEWQSPHAEKDLIGDNEVMIRLVASFTTTEDDVDALRALLN